MSLTLELFKSRCSADNRFALVVKVPLDLFGKISVSESDDKFIWIHKSSSYDLNLSTSFAGPTLWINVVNSDRSIEESSIIICKDVRENSVFRIFYDLSRCDFNWAFAMTNVPFTPWVRFPVIVYRKSSVLAASNFNYWLHNFAFTIVANKFRIPVRVFVSKTSLPIVVKTPCVEFTTVAEGCRMPESSSTTLNLNSASIRCRRKVNLCRQSDVSMLVNSKLTETGFSPSVHWTIISDCKRIKCSSGNSNNLLPMEVFHVRRNSCQLNCGWNTELALEASAPGIQVASVCQH